MMVYIQHVHVLTICVHDSDTAFVHVHSSQEDSQGVFIGMLEVSQTFFFI